jgi:hypothetical protein
MAKRTPREASTGRYSVVAGKERHAPHVVDRTTGRELPLKGYGSMKGQYVIKGGIDITKPILGQSTPKK